jgi:hypothetical protein
MKKEIVAVIKPLNVIVFYLVEKDLVDEFIEAKSLNGCLASIVDNVKINSSNKLCFEPVDVDKTNIEDFI